MTIIKNKPITIGGDNNDSTGNSLDKNSKNSHPVNAEQGRVKVINTDKGKNNKEDNKAGQERYVGYVLVLKHKNISIKLEVNDLISLPLIFEQEQLLEESFSFEDYIDKEKYEIVFVQSHAMLKNQIVALRKLAKENQMDLI